jgi:hypothetical protein
LSGQLQKQRPEFGYWLLLFVIVTGFYWKLVFTQQYDWLAGPDMTQQVLPWHEEEARQFQHSQFPLWDPHSWGGQPMLGQAQPGAAYPLNWLFWLVPRQHGHIAKAAWQWYYVIIHYMAALFCFLLCRDLGLGRAASLIAALLFALAGYVGRTDWPQMLNGGIWAPLLIMFVLRAAHGIKPMASAALAGLCLGLSWLSGHHDAPIHLTLATGGLWLYFVFRNRSIDWRMVGLAALVLGLAFSIGALQILPAQENGRLSMRWAPGALHWNEPVAYAEHQNLALYAASLFGVVFPGLHRNVDPFIGIVGFTLMLLGITAAWTRPAVKLFAALGMAGLLFTLGHQSIFHGVIYSLVPIMEKSRTPSRALVIFNVAAAVLAAYGIDSFVAAAGKWARRFVVGVTVFGLVTLAVVFGVIATNKLSWPSDDRLILSAFIALLFAALLYGWRSGNLTTRTAQVLLTLLVIQELGNDAPYSFHDRATKDPFAESATGNRDIAEFLHAMPGVFRSDSATDLVVGNWGDYYDLDLFHSYLAGATENVLRFRHDTWQTQALLGIRYTLATKPERAGQTEVFAGQSGVKVYENPEAFPRAWSVHDVGVVKSIEEGHDLIQEHLSEMHAKAFMIANPPKLETCGGQEWVWFTERRPSRVSLRAQMECTGMVVLSDTYYPGWRALVDGKPAEIYEVNIAMRGVVVPKGGHKISFRFRPTSAVVGAALSLGGVLVVCALVFVGRRRALPAHT